MSRGYFCKIEKVEMAEAKKKPFDPYALVECVFYDESHKVYRDLGITGELMENRHHLFKNGPVTVDHQNEMLDPRTFRGIIQSTTYVPENGIGTMVMGVIDEETLNLTEKKGVSPEYLLSVEGQAVMDIFPRSNTICDKMKPRMPSAIRTGYQVVCMGYLDYIGRTYADEENKRLPCDTIANLKATALILDALSYGGKSAKALYTEEQLDDMRAFVLAKRIEFGYPESYY